MAVPTTQTSQIRKEITAILTAKDALRVQISKLVQTYTELGGATFFESAFPQDIQQTEDNPPVVTYEVTLADLTTAIVNLGTLETALGSVGTTVPANNYDSSAKLRV